MRREVGGETRTRRRRDARLWREILGLGGASAIGARARPLGAFDASFDRDARVDRVTREREDERTSVCSMAMFMYPSRHARMPL